MGGKLRHGGKLPEYLKIRMIEERVEKKHGIKMELKGDVACAQSSPLGELGNLRNAPRSMLVSVQTALLFLVLQ